MSCSCLAKLLAALQPPWIALPPLHIPPVMLKLTEALGPIGALKAAATISASATMSAHLSAIAKLGLPPISASVAASVTAAAHAVVQAQAHLGIDLFHPEASARLALAFSPLNLLPPIQLPPAGPIGSLLGLLGTMGSIKASLAVDLLTPGAGIALTAALHAAVAAAASFTANLAIPLPALHVAANYAAVAAAAASMGCTTASGLGAKLSLLASLQVPSLKMGFGPLAELLSLLSLLKAANSTLGFSPFSVDAAARLQVGLAPLSLVASAKLDEAVAVAVAAGPPMVATGGLSLAASLAASLSAFASLAASVKLPNLAPALAVSAVMGHAKTGAGPCASSCPVAV